MNATERLHGRWFATITEAAEVLHVDPRTVRRAIDRGELPAVRVGQQLRVPVAWLRERAMLDGSPPTPVALHAVQEETAEAAPCGAASAV
ncbi:DNA binding domain-containing protein, excisionase family [Streptomyces sp. 3213]|uniref:helix-turn-helix domain-containing protein n=1 Tax=Streptomyces sp. 3213.3 TaxID=1855348 RepID=UPI000896B984|nr:helix-turn-helix domain-containing protein [Streptomyces sp. 3213.3]SEC89202.1 DNA binding domain-containing protein, excisionase family [Streptomyces sp. 3213] [Streptomyces sp. 3213.3]